MALIRAELPRPHAPGGDPDAQRLLCAGMRPTWAWRLRPGLAARTRFVDDQVLAAISAGIGQVVILGAGYDDRALRFRSPGVRFFEVDHPATQADKARRLRAIPAGPDGADGADDGLVLAAADFRVADIATVLAAAGHDAAQPSLFICEGLLVYLDRPTGTRLLAGLRSRAAPGSILAASLATHREGVSSDVAAAVANARRHQGTAEPWLTILPAADHLALLAQAGWRADQPGQVIDQAELGTGAEPGHGLLAVARPR